MRCSVRILEDFTVGNSRKSQIHKSNEKCIGLGINNSRLKAKLLAEIISKTLFHYCLLHLISLRGLDVKINAKQQSERSISACNTINDYPMEPP